MFTLKKDLKDINQRVIIQFEKDYSGDFETLKEIEETIEGAFFDWLHCDTLYDEEDLAEVECMNPARFITERLDSYGYSTVNYSLEDLKTQEN